MSTQITNYQCPACTGPLHFDPEIGKLSCDFCGSSFEPAEIEALYAQKDAQAAENKAAADQKRKDSKATGTGDEWDLSGLNDN
jgi:uncharacterized Zn finger protein (UPF0148 family)